MSYLSYKQTLDLLHDHGQLNTHRLLEKERTILFTNQDGLPRSLTLPHTFPNISQGITLSAYRDSIPDEPPSRLLILIQAGAAALAHFDDKATQHKVITKYMVRRGQGKSQLHYAQTKGKSRMGSRIRLQQSRAFFKEINDKLHQWKENIEAAGAIYLSCPLRLVNELYKEKSHPPFPRDDFRIHKIPFTVHKPGLKELHRIDFLLNAGRLEEQ